MRRRGRVAGAVLRLPEKIAAPVASREREAERKRRNERDGAREGMDRAARRRRVGCIVVEAGPAHRFVFI
jgi:hypothetical protein